VLALLRRFYVARIAGVAGSEAYWNRRYDVGGDSGRGSYGEYAEFKAGVLNEFVDDHGIESVIEFGCGDGNQLTLARYPRYQGFDVSERAVALCEQRFGDDATKSFGLLRDYVGESADLVLSLDVIFHLIEDDVFDAHLRTVFTAARRFVIVYASNTTVRRPLQRAHVRHRKFTDWVTEHAREWTLMQQVANPARAGDDTSASFFVFGQANESGR
jgi:SAM-dependent methyltransferase